MRIAAAAIVITVCLTILGCTLAAPAQPKPLNSGSADSAKPPIPLPEEPPKPVIPSPVRASLVAVGDVMMHTPQLPGAYDKASGLYNFTGFFQPVKSLLSGADWAVVNLETPIAGDQRGFHGYPRFNAPIALADALTDAGFDVVSTANNHALDQGANGLIHTLAVLREKGLEPIGTAESEEAAQNITILERNGISAAFLSYTYGTNGIPLPADKPYLVNLIEEARIEADIARAKQMDADFIAVSLHFGNEYERKPNERQKQIAKTVAEAGANLIIGHHPHVVQPYEWMQVKDPDGTLRSALVMYSLGNFISNQFGNYKEFGAILQVELLKEYEADGSSKTSIAELKTIPTWVHKYVSGGKSRYRILTLEEGSGTQSDPYMTEPIRSMLAKKAVEMNDHLASMAKETDAAPAKSK